MKKLIHLPLLILLFIWEFPQNMLGIIIYLIFRRKHLLITSEKESSHFFFETTNLGVSLGKFIFWKKSGNRYAHLKNDCRMHEYGHALQSLMLGPLYLIVIGIPSISRFLFARWYQKRHHTEWKNYFNAFPENWADKLGGVTGKA